MTLDESNIPVPITPSRASAGRPTANRKPTVHSHWRSTSSARIST